MSLYQNLVNTQREFLANLQAHYARVTTPRLRTCFPEFIHMHQLHFVIICMPHLKCLSKVDLIQTSPTHLTQFAPSTTDDLPRLP